MKPEYETCVLAQGYRLQKYNSKVYCMREDQNLESRIMQVNDMAMKPSELVEMKKEADEIAEGGVKDQQAGDSSERGESVNDSEKGFVNGDSMLDSNNFKANDLEYEQMTPNSSYQGQRQPSDERTGGSPDLANMRDKSFQSQKHSDDVDIFNLKRGKKA